MIHYLRIPKSKFWGWVYSSLAVGLLLGAGAAWAVTRIASSGQIDSLQQQLASERSQSASATAALQTRLDSASASLTTVQQQLDTLKASGASTRTASSGESGSSAEQSQTVTLKVISRTVDPSTVATGNDIELRAVVQGDVDKVTMRIYESGGGNPKTYSLKKSSGDSSKSTWHRYVSAPTYTGTFYYFATAYSGSKSATMQGASPSHFEVVKHKKS